MKSQIHFLVNWCGNFQKNLGETLNTRGYQLMIVGVKELKENMMAVLRKTEKAMMRAMCEDD